MRAKSYFSAVTFLICLYNVRGAKTEFSKPDTSHTMTETFYGRVLARIHRDAYESVFLNVSSHLLAIMRDHGILEGTVVDLACGAGGWAGILVREGYRVFGLDISPAMIRLARKRAPGAIFACGSMVSIPYPRCDAITGLGESVNYLVRTSEVRGLFRRAYKALRRGGIFLFDLWEPPRSGTRIRRNVARVEDSWAVFADIEENGASRDVVRRITWFCRAGRNYRRGNELHRQRLYASGEIAGWLREAGFRVRCLRRYAGWCPGPRRAIVVARKP